MAQIASCSINVYTAFSCKNDQKVGHLKVAFPFGSYFPCKLDYLIPFFPFAIRVKCVHLQRCN